MKEEIYLSELYDYYKMLLTEKQRKYFEDYYFENLSLSEISENYLVSRNAISKQLLNIKEKLYEYEKYLKLRQNKNKIKEILSEEEIKKIEKYI